MKDQKLIGQSLAAAAGVLVYTSIVAWILYNGNAIFGKMNTFFGPLAFLLLFVLSAAVVGTLVGGKPAYMYFNGEKPAGVKLLLYTIAWLFIITVIVLATQIII